MIKFNQKAWLKPYIDMNTKLKQKAKNNFEEKSFKLMNNVVEELSWGKCEKTYIFVTTERRRNDIVSEPNYPT